LAFNVASKLAESLTTYVSAKPFIYTLPFPTAAAEWKGKTHIPYPTPKSIVLLELLRISGEHTPMPTPSTDFHARGEESRYE